MKSSVDFIQKFEACGNDQQKLIALMAQLDETKRSLKDRLTRLSSEPNGEFGRGRERQEQIRKIKAKQGFLTDHRELVRAKLGRLKMDTKSLKRITNSRKPDFTMAFMAAAERMLTEEQFLDLEVRAQEILDGNDG